MRSISMFILVLCLSCVSCATKAAFRSDYNYMPSTQSFYKIHKVPKTWAEAKAVCESEGTSLFYPENEHEADVFGDVLDKQEFSFVFAGISARNTEGVYTTIDGKPLDSVYHSWAADEPSNERNESCAIFRHDGTLLSEDCASEYRYICKKSLSMLDWDSKCQMPKSRGYHFNEATGHCYKFHSTPRSWTHAYVICSNEDSYLAVLNSQLETDILVNLTNISPRNPVGDFQDEHVHLGFHNPDDNGWTTVQGVPLLESGFSKWHPNEPNNYREKCGSMYMHGYLNDMYCDTKCFFICEHDVPCSDC